MKKVIVYTMEGCEWCSKMKKSLREEKIKFIERDIEKYQEEYDLFVEATGNEYVPAFMLLEVDNDNYSNVKLLTPDVDYQDINEAIIKVKEYLI
jgi:glutaredoxin